MIKKEFDFKDAHLLRKKAEEQLNKKQNKFDITIIETYEKKLLYELQVHQIELEMQNEELRQAYEKAESALKKYTTLYDFAPIGYFTLDHEGSICDLNFNGAKMLGDSRFSLLNSNFKLFISEESKPEFNVFFGKVYTSNTKESCEVMLGYENNPLCYVYAEGVVTGNERRCLLSLVDISDFKR